MLKHIPNILTVIRLIFIPFIVVAIVNSEFVLAIVLFTISSITDILDGVIARKFNFISNFGKLMDPVADKLTQIAVTCTLAAKHIIPWWIFLFIILKEIIMMSGGLYLFKRKDVVVHSKWYGKLTTVLIYVAVVSSFLIEVVAPLNHKFWCCGFYVTFDVYIYIIAIAFALFSLFSYIQLFWQDNVKKENR